MKTNKSAKTKIGKLKKQKTKEIKVSRGVTGSIPMGQGKKGKSTATAKLMVGLDLSGFKKKQAPLQNGKELKPIMIKPNMGRMVKPMAKFPDLSGDGKVTKKDILMGRGVIKKPKMQFDGDKKLQQQLQNAVVLDNVDFGLSKEDIQTGNTLDALRDAIKTKGKRSSKENKDLLKSIREGKLGNIKSIEKQGTGINKLGFRLKDYIKGKQAGDRLLIDTETGEISRPDRAAVTPYLRRIGIDPKNRPNMINKPKMQNGKTLKEIQADITRVGKIAISTSDPNERDAALMKKKILIRERDDMIAASKKKAKTNKTNTTNKTKPTMIKKKAKMIKKPKLGKKPSMVKKPKLGKKPTMAKKPKMIERKAKKAVRAMASTGSGNPKRTAKKQLRVVKKGGGAKIGKPTVKAKKPMMGHKKPKMGHKKK